MYEQNNKKMTQVKKYLVNLIEEKGRDITSDIEGFEGHINLTYEILIEFLTNLPKDQQQQIRHKLVMIDFKNGDVFHFLHYLTEGMIKLAGY